MDGATVTDRTRVVGWAFVAGQAVLLATLILLPGADHWDVPGWLRRIADAIVIIGVAAAVAAALGLGRRLTPTPVPRAESALETGGLYRFVRHPIYTGVILVVVGVAARSGNLWSATVAFVTIVFFHIKARWEERRLAERFDDYEAYCERTPRFIPRLPRGR